METSCSNSESVRRRTIMEISKENISMEEKTRKIQRLYMSSERDEEDENHIEVCDHVPTKCSKFEFSCCSKKWGCKKCHEKCPDNSEVSLLLRVTCNACNECQPPSKRCRKCTTRFSHYYCPDCVFWTERRSFHCRKCGICRHGDSKDYHHCNDCNSCFLKTEFPIHRHSSSEIKRDDQCPICKNDQIIAEDVSHVLRCGHVVHQKCKDKLLSNPDTFQCPECRKTIRRMFHEWAAMDNDILCQPMEEERYVKILCYDCSSESYTLHHYIGHKCMYCNSYNTSLT